MPRRKTAPVAPDEQRAPLTPTQREFMWRIVTDSDPKGKTTVEVWETAVPANRAGATFPGGTPGSRLALQDGGLIFRRLNSNSQRWLQMTQRDAEVQAIREQRRGNPERQPAPVITMAPINGPLIESQREQPYPCEHSMINEDNVCLECGVMLPQQPPSV